MAAPDFQLVRQCGRVASRRLRRQDGAANPGGAGAWSCRACQASGLTRNRARADRPVRVAAGNAAQRGPRWQGVRNSEVAARRLALHSCRIDRTAAAGPQFAPATRQPWLQFSRISPRVWCQLRTANSAGKPVHAAALPAHLLARADRRRASLTRRSSLCARDTLDQSCLAKSLRYEVYMCKGGEG